MDINIKDGKQGHSAYLVLDDKSRQIEVAIFTKTYDECSNLLKHDGIVVIEGRLQQDRMSGRHKIVAYNVKNIDMLREEKVSHVKLDINLSELTPEKISNLKNIMSEQPEGGCEVMASHLAGGVQKMVSIGSKKVRLDDGLISKLNQLFGKESVHIEYKTGSQSPINRSEQAKAKAEGLIRIGNETRNDRHAKISTLLYNAEMAMR
ncbi:DNA polymerase III subunit alpha [compost metagenome]